LSGTRHGCGAFFERLVSASEPVDPPVGSGCCRRKPPNV